MYLPQGIFSNQHVEKLNEFKQELSKEILAVRKKLGEVVNDLCTDKTESAATSWADIVNQRRRKHLVVMKVSVQDK